MFLFSGVSGEKLIMVAKTKLSSWVCEEAENVAQAMQRYSGISKEVIL